MSRFAKIRRLISPRWRIIEILGSALTLSIIVYAVVVASLQAEDGMTWGTDFRVDFLLPGGPAERAGIQLGDRILAIEGHPVDAWHLPVTRWRPGDTIQVAIERDGRRLVRPVRLERPSSLERWRAIAPLLVAFSFWAVSSLMPGMARQSAEVRLFRAFSQVGSATLAAGNISTVGLVWAGHLFGALAGALAPLILHFHLTLPGARLEQWRRPILLAAYAIGVAVVLPYLMLGPVSRWWWAGWGNRGLRIALVGALLGSLTWLGYSYVTTRSPETRRRLRFLLLGTGWGFVPILFLSLLPELLGLAFVPYPFTMPFLAAIPLVYWYATMRFDLLRVDLVLNRSLVYLSIALVLSGTYLLIVRLIRRFLPGAALSQELVGALLLATTGIAIVPLRNLIQRGVDQALYGGWYDYESVVSDISRSLVGTLDRDVLERLLLDRVADTLWVRDAALLLPEPGSSEQLVGQVGALSIDPSFLSLERDGSLARRLCKVDRPVETFWLQQKVDQESLAPSEKALLDSEAIRWWVPIVGEDRMNGLLLLGARVGGEGFGPDDLRILDTLSDQAALAIENILLTEKLRLQLGQLERSCSLLVKTHQRLITSREEERKRLARELHDRPVQELLALRYRLGECVSQIDAPDLRRVLEELRDETLVLANELRVLCRELRPPVLDAFGLAEAIRSHSEEIGERYGLSVQLTLENDEDWPLSEEASVSLFRIHQEALSNVIRHADADQVAIRLYREGSKVTLEVEDDGVGFAVPDSMDQLADEGRFGLLGVRERIKLLGGEFKLASQPGKGTILRVHLPIGSDDVRPDSYEGALEG